MRSAPPGRLLLLWFAALLLVCSCRQKRESSPPEPPKPVVITFVGTNDLHGHLERLPLLAGFVDILRQERAKDGGAVVLVDAGDMFQGTLESNTTEGAAVIELYDALGYSAAAIGNHEFDFGPAGPKATPKDPGDDPRGALKARAKQAGFPLLAANLARAEDDRRVQWQNVPASVLIERRGVKIGIVGVTTESTPHTTMATNFAGLEIEPLAETISTEADRLRAHGADLVIVAAHAGGHCEKFDDPHDLSSCNAKAEIFRVARALEPGSADLIVAGHSHAGIAHFVAGTPIIESYSKGIAFGRADVTVVPGEGARDVHLYPPHFLCKKRSPPCEPGEYDGAEVSPDPRIAGLAEKFTKQARELRERPLGVKVKAAVERAYGEESALGNLFADLMRKAFPKADVALTNGGGLRADLPAGELTYGALYEAMPFDNRFATIRLRAGQLRRILAANLESKHGIFSISGLRIRARCRDGELKVQMQREDGRRVDDDETILVVTSDFLAHGGDEAISELNLADDAIQFRDGRTIRDQIAAVLKKRGGTLSGEDPDLFDRDHRRFLYPGERPVKCR